MYAIRSYYVGHGKQIYTLLENINKCKETVAVAGSDVFERKMKKFLETAQKSNADNGKSAELKGYHYYRELLERKDIDAVV